MKKNSMCGFSKTKQKKRIEKKEIYYYQDTDITKFVDNLDNQEKIKKRIEEINKQIEEVGQLCDKRVEEQVNLCEEAINKEREEIDAKTLKIIKDFEEYLENYKKARKVDYKGIYKKLTKDLKELAKEIDNKILALKDCEEKKVSLEEDDDFYDQQFTFAQDLNTYLRYKLNMLKEDKKESTKESQNNSIIHSKNKSTLTQSSYIPTAKSRRTRKPGFLLTSVNSSTQNMNTKGSLNSSLNHSLMTDLERVKLEFDIAERKVKKKIKEIDKSTRNKMKDYQAMKYATSNPFTSIMKSLSQEMKFLLPEIEGKHLYKSSQSSIETEESSLNTINLNDYFSKGDKKKIVSRFLENKEFKTILFDYLYKE